MSAINMVLGFVLFFLEEVVHNCIINVIQDLKIVIYQNKKRPEDCWVGLDSLIISLNSDCVWWEKIIEYGDYQYFFFLVK